MIKIKPYFIIILIIVLISQPIELCAEIISGGWSNDRAYRPAPIIFLHGFATGSPEGWSDVNSSLLPYFINYYNPQKVNFPDSLSGTTNNYLERIRFFKLDDSDQERLINGNSSIDTYKIGDYYVLKGKRKPGDPGWSDKVNEIVDPVLNAYKVNEVIFVCHSMGGLAAREYLRNTNSQASYKVITLGTPHLGAYMASIDKSLLNTQKSGWFFPGNGWILSCLIEGLDRGLELKSKIDADGDAAKDMTPGSNFLNTLNSSSQPYNTEFFAIVGNKPGNVGDGVVTVGSQEGQGVLRLKDKIRIAATHGEEPQVAARGKPSPILKFIDCQAPEIQITKPDPNAFPVEEIAEFQTNVKGIIRNEYLPADVSLLITITNEDDGSTQVIGEDGSLKLKASDLWNPLDSGSPVAEFDEKINLWSTGNYLIKVVAKNPAGITSTEKTARVIVKKKVKERMVYYIRENSIRSGEGLIPTTDPTFDTSLCRFGKMSYKLIDKQASQWGFINYTYEFTLIPDNTEYSPRKAEWRVSRMQYYGLGMAGWYYHEPANWKIVEKTVIADGVKSITDLLGVLAYCPSQPSISGTLPSREVGPEYIYVDGAMTSGGTPPKGSVVYGLACYYAIVEEFYANFSVHTNWWIERNSYTQGEIPSFY